MISIPALTLSLPISTRHPSTPLYRSLSPSPSRSSPLDSCIIIYFFISMHAEMSPRSAVTQGRTPVAPFSAQQDHSGHLRLRPQRRDSLGEAGGSARAHLHAALEHGLDDAAVRALQVALDPVPARLKGSYTPVHCSAAECARAHWYSMSRQSGNECARAHWYSMSRQ